MSSVPFFHTVFLPSFSIHKSNPVLLIPVKSLTLFAEGTRIDIKGTGKSVKSKNTGKPPVLLGIVVIAKGQRLFLKIGKKKTHNFKIS